MSNLKGKVAVVIGGARDIGRAVSLALSKEGARVVVNYFSNKENADETLRLISESGGEAIAVQANATLQSGVNKIVAATTKQYGDKVDILVNVAGGMMARKTIEEADEIFFDAIMNVNFKSVFLVTKAFKPFMHKGASIINFSSQAARDGGGPGASLYAASKGAVMTYTRSLAKEFGPSGIRVNSLCPGMISTKLHDDFTKEQVRQNVAAATPLRREGQADEVANLVKFLASDDSSFLTGNNIDINGGLMFS